MPYVSLQSANFPDRFVRHQNFLGELSPIQSNLDRQDATFWLMDGATVGDVVELRSTNFPLHVLRHQDFRLKLHEYNPPLAPPGGARPETPEERLLREDSRFILERGLAEPGNPAAVSFRSFNFHDRFIRHRDFHLFVEAPGTGPPGPQDATFRVVAPFAPPPPIVLH
jgi:Alpha-L-arabinofuranosidase B (ABFB) domain